MRELAEKWANFILANLLWSILAIPLVTLPAATAALFSVMSDRVRGSSVPFFVGFFGAMRRLWLKATLVVLGDVVVGGLLLINVLIFRAMPLYDVVGILSRSVTVFAVLALLLANLYLWSLMVVVEMSLSDLLTTAFRLVFLYPLRSLGILLAAAVPIVVSLLLPRGVFLLITASTTALIITTGTWPLIQRHLPEETLSTNQSTN
jgi:uncharacterized membrane protein YesL